MNAAAAEYPDGVLARFPAWPRLALLTELFAALSSRFGGDADPLDEDAVLELVERARAGDRMAGERLYRQLVDRVFRTVRGMLHTDADAEDVTQDALLTMLTSLDRYSPRADTRFAAWVTTIAVNTTRRRFRRRRPEPTETGLLPEIADDDTDVERDVDAARKRRALLNALGELSRRERDIVSLRYGAELSANEIANIVTLEPANVRKVLERTRARLGAQIEAFLESKGEIS
jgi:RNA polymerase sigma-70 factor (ECF subfamily)